MLTPTKIAEFTSHYDLEFFPKNVTSETFNLPFGPCSQGVTVGILMVVTIGEQSKEHNQLMQGGGSLKFKGSCGCCFFFLVQH